FIRVHPAESTADGTAGFRTSKGVSGQAQSVLAWLNFLFVGEQEGCGTGAQLNIAFGIGFSTHKAVEGDITTQPEGLLIKLARQKIAFHRQSADFAVQLVSAGLIGLLAGFLPADKRPLKPPQTSPQSYQ
ncbi:MAG: hypothetical protein SV429_13415, partial [Pseudomonadota bacterium]|nr:hypothetical protein [Pseudomonadota bacterium]